MYSTSQLAHIISARVLGSSTAMVSGLSIDSRMITEAHSTVFVAIGGQHHNGHRFIPQLMQSGVCVFVVDQQYDTGDTPHNVCFLRVSDTVRALQQLAAFHRRQFGNIPTIGITGSNGKTIVKEWLYQCLHTDHNICRSPKSYNSQVGVPLSVWQLNRHHNMAVFEAGISKPCEMQLISEIIQPTLGICTNIGDAHQENFADVAQKIDEKILLFQHADAIVYCSDHVALHESISKKYPHKKLCNWSVRSGTAWLAVSSIKVVGTNSVITARCEHQNIVVNIPFIDSAAQQNAVTVLAVLLYFCVDVPTIVQRMSLIESVAMRLEQKSGINNCTLINDFYNSDINALQIALSVMNRHAYSRKTLIMSDIQQSGMSNHLLYTVVNDYLTSNSITKLIGIGSQISSHATLLTAPAERYFFTTTNEFLLQYSSEQFHNELILLKGSRSFAFERISNVLQEKHHRTILEIDLNALIHNLSYFKSLLAGGVKIMAMVKAFAYGSGLVEIAQLLQFQGVNYLCVAYTDEGILLRKQGITRPILVLNPESDEYGQIVEYNLEPEIYSLSGFAEFARIVLNYGLPTYPVHLKINTGMNRLGFDETDMLQLSTRLQNSPQILVKSIFSHLAAADDEHYDDFTNGQIATFERISLQIEAICGYKCLKHILNSSGIERFAQAQFDMVRLGIGLYGVGQHQHKIKNISRLKTKISQIRTLTAEQTVGYSRNGALHRPSRIATIAIGYADGFSRKLGNGNYSLTVNGQKVPTVGNVCMDMCMIDVTDTQAREGDEVIIFGNSEQGENSVLEMAVAAQTIPYEILTSISGRVKKVYVQE